MYIVLICVVQDSFAKYERIGMPSKMCFSQHASLPLAYVERRLRLNAIIPFHTFSDSNKEDVDEPEYEEDVPTLKSTVRQHCPDPV